MQENIAIYRPDDIPTAAFGWNVSFDPLLQLLTQIGLKPILPQRRLHPSWREHSGMDSQQIYDVVEIPARQYVENKQRLASLGFAVWPEHEDAVSALYAAHDD